MAVADSSTLYTRLSPFHFSDFTPSRVTRPSSNPFLQEHDPISDLYALVRTNRDRSHSAMVCSNNVPLKGRYIDVEFAVSYPPVGSRSRREKQVEINEEPRKHSKSDPTAAYFNPLCTRKRSESKRTAFRKKQTDDIQQPDGDVMKTMETPTFVVFESSREESKCNGVHSPPSKPFKSAPLGLPAANKIRIKKRRLSPPRTPPPPPPPPPEVTLIAEPVESIAVSLQRGDQTTGMIESGMSACVAKPSSSYVVLHRVDREQADDANCAATNAHEGVTAAERSEWQPSRDASSAESPTELHLERAGSNSPLACQHEEEEEGHTDSENSLTNSTDCGSDGDSGGLVDTETEPIPIPPPRRHKLLSRSTPSPPLGQAGQSLPGNRYPLTSITPPIPSPLLQNGGTASPPPLSPPQLSPSSTPPFSPLPVIGKTRPVPPPRQRSISQADTIRCSPDGRALKAMHSSPAILSEKRQRTASFLQCKAGEDRGQYAADYLGWRETDCYISCVDQVAKQLVDSKPVEVVAYVTSEKVRLAPPNSVLLFKSFAMKDVLGVEKCSKNKRIVGVLVWKSRGVPSCHILRCPTHIIANSLYETIWFQSQNIDEVMLSKISTPVASSHLPRPPSDISSSDSSYEDTVPQTPPHAREMPLSPTELLHKFPATHIGSAVAGKLHSVNEVIQKVLSVNKPSHAKEVCVWLSLAQVRLVDMSDESEIMYAMHETSRIRAIGVYAPDKRFIGYIIKEVGKPLTGHVLRCNSAGLMVSLMSFLRQSCQITFYQRGGSFYDELSADDSEDFDYSPENSGGCESPGIIKRLRSLTMSNRLATSVHSQPSFVSHAPLLRQLSPAHDVPQRKRDLVQTPSSHSLSHAHSVVSPLDFTEDDYAKFMVNYVGSAVMDRPLSQQSILDALRSFEEAGVAGGQAAVQKNVIHMQVSSLGINLTDKKHRLFVSRNYPRKQLEGYCLHPTEPRCFAFASKRPGFPHSMKCHVFRQVQEPIEQILDGVRFWLELEPVVSELDPFTS